MLKKYIIKDISPKTKKEIGNRLKTFAQVKFGGVTGLAKVIGVPQSQLSKYTTGNTVPSGYILFSLAQVGLSLDYLFLGDKKTGNESFTKMLNIYGISDPKQLEDVLKLIKNLKSRIDNYH
ncbi:MAG: hypothetical protein IH950_14515 [Bacteroidetes bacterium]|nr:hypothetical protein [Bacteroidota bacterium]MCH8034957.1 hypothetical protein [Bacteroidota bacterium]